MGRATAGRYFTWFITVYDDHRVIRTGPFRFIRHRPTAAPCCCSSARCSSARLIGAALSLVFQLFAYVRRIRYERSEMIERLGEGVRDLHARGARPRATALVIAALPVISKPFGSSQGRLRDGPGRAVSSSIGRCSDACRVRCDTTPCITNHAVYHDTRP